MTDTGKVTAVYVGAEDVLEKNVRDAIDLDLEGIVGDRHRGLARECWEADKQPEGTLRRNERQWSAVSVEELNEITELMSLSEPLDAGTIGANLCIDGFALSRLPRGSLLRFESGAVLMVEEYNPPCSDMGAKIAEEYVGQDSTPIAVGAFSEAAKFLRGVVGVVEVPGTIRVGDSVTVELERLPKWLRR